MTKTERDQTPISIRDQFMRNIGENGGDVSTAFVDVLNVIDQRLQKSANAVAATEDTFDRLAIWYELANARLQKMPVEVNDNLAQGLRRALPEMTLQIKRDAYTGAKNGATLTQDAIQALRDEADRYESRRARLTTFATVGLPIAFTVAVLSGFLLGSFAIPALPTTWEWPCRLIGAEFRISSTDATTSFCVIQRK